VVELSAVRASRQLASYQNSIGAVLAANRKTLARLHTSGALFSPEGVRAGRHLLLAYQHLLRVVALLQRLSERAQLPGPMGGLRYEGVCRELDHLLERSSALAERTNAHLGRMVGR